MSTLQEIRAKLKAQETKSSGQGTYTKDLTTYAHWDLPEPGTSLLRFLPDGDPDNTFFWRERQLIKLPFAGVKGNKDHKNVIVQVPCMDMWERNSCPVITEVGPWFNDTNLEALARSYWKKRTYLMQGFVAEDGLPDAPVPENPIRKFVISPQIFKIIKGALLDPEMENNPTDFNHGTNFRINKTKNGQYADYSTSVWARKESSLTTEQQEAISKHGLFNLNDFMPKKPNAEELNAIKEMFEASVNGELYDLERWGKYYKPFGVGGNDRDDKDSTPVASKPAKVESKVETPVAEVTTKVTKTEVAETSTASSGQASAQDILARIRRRSSEG